MLATAIIGALTGFVSAMLFASASTGSALGVLVLFFLSPMPVAIAGLGWNSRAALIAVVVGALSIFLISAGRLSSPLFYVSALGAPAVVFAHYLLLARPVTPPATATSPAPQPVLEWYPIGRVVAFAALWAGVLATIAMLLIHSDLDTVKAALGKSITQLAAQGFPLPGQNGQAGANAPPTPEQIENVSRIMLAIMPGMIAGLWFAVAMVNVWLAGVTVRAAGRLVRPWPDLAALALPPSLALVLAAGLAGSFLDGTLGRIAGCIAAGCFAAYTLGGLAVLHHVTRGIAIRPLVLMAAYSTLILIPPISALGISLLALAEPILSWNRRGPPPGSSPTQPPGQPPSA